MYLLNNVNTLISVLAILSSHVHEKGLITKECIVTHIDLNFVFNWALHFSISAITRFNSGTKLFQATINTATL